MLIIFTPLAKFAACRVWLSKNKNKNKTKRSPKKKKKNAWNKRKASLQGAQYLTTQQVFNEPRLPLPPPNHLDPSWKNALYQPASFCQTAWWRPYLTPCCRRTATHAASSHSLTHAPYATRKCASMCGVWRGRSVMGGQQGLATLTRTQLLIFVPNFFA